MTAPAALRWPHDSGKALVLQRQRDAQILELLLIDDVGGTAHRLTGVLHLREGDDSRIESSPSISMTSHYTHRDAASLAALLDRAIPDLHDERDVIDAQVIEEGK